MKKKTTVNPARAKKVTLDDLSVMMTRGFEGVYKDIAEGREEMNGLARMVARGFSAVDEKFEQVDKRFEQVNTRLDNIENKLLINHENRFDRIDDKIRILETSRR